MLPAFGMNPDIPLTEVLLLLINLLQQGSRRPKPANFGPEWNCIVQSVLNNMDGVYPFCRCTPEKRFNLVNCRRIAAKTRACTASSPCETSRRPAWFPSAASSQIELDSQPRYRNALMHGTMVSRSTLLQSIVVCIGDYVTVTFPGQRERAKHPEPCNAPLEPLFTTKGVWPWP
jgi:hypothetical protein